MSELSIKDKATRFLSRELKITDGDPTVVVYRTENLTQFQNPDKNGLIKALQPITEKQFV